MQCGEEGGMTDVIRFALKIFFKIIYWYTTIEDDDVTFFFAFNIVLY